MRTLSIRAKLVLAIVATLCASGLASTALVRALYERTARTASEEALRGAALAYEDLERSDVEKLSAILDVLVTNPALREAFAAKDRERLLAVSLPMHQVLKSEHGINHWNFIEAETRKMFLRPHLPSKYGDVVERQSLIKAMSRLETSVGMELGKGRPLDDVVNEMKMVAEGVKTTAAVLELAARHEVEMPLASFVGRVLYEGARPADLVPELMLRKAKPEFHGMR